MLYAGIGGAQTTTSRSPACATVLTPSYSPPVVAKGWKAQLVATGLTSPRGIKFDTNGGLLVIEQGVGLSRLTFIDNGGTCLSVQSNKTVIADKEVGFHHYNALDPDSG
jgi:glucose/arabinose dehydrogenase